MAPRLEFELTQEQIKKINEQAFEDWQFKQKQNQHEYDRKTFQQNDLLYAQEQKRIAELQNQPVSKELAALQETFKKVQVSGHAGKSSFTQKEQKESIKQIEKYIKNNNADDAAVMPEVKLNEDVLFGLLGGYPKNNPNSLFYQLNSASSVAFGELREVKENEIGATGGLGLSQNQDKE